MKRILSIITSVFLVSGFAFTLTPKEEKGVITIESDALEYKSPTRFKPVSLEKAPEEIEYWTSILPYKEDRNDDMYIVLPTLGLITPVVFVPEGSEDYKLMTTGKEIDINKYLPEGVMHYPSTGIPGEDGNPVIFGHSNFFKSREGKYKSIFADIMNLDVGARDEMRVYIKQGSEYELRKFSIDESYETHPEDVGILTPKGGKELTVFACTNGLNGRWILRGKLIEDNEVLVPYKYKYKMFDILSELSKHPNKQKIIVQGIQKIQDISAEIPASGRTYNEKLKVYILKYLKDQLALIY